MTGNKPADCKKQAKRIEKEQRPHFEEGWKPKTLDSPSTLYRLIPETSYNPKSKRIDRNVFEDAGLSVIASGGEFEEIDVKEKLAEANRDGDRKFVGAVKIDSAVFTSKAYGEFDIRHDPHPFEYRGEMKSQDANHVSILCVKPEEMVDMFVDSPDWVVKPEEPDQNS